VYVAVTGVNASTYDNNASSGVQTVHEGKQRAHNAVVDLILLAAPHLCHRTSHQSTPWHINLRFAHIGLPYADQHEHAETEFSRSTLMACTAHEMHRCLQHFDGAEPHWKPSYTTAKAYRNEVMSMLMLRRHNN